MSILENIKKENDIKNISMRDMDNLAEEIRELIIESVGENGGHLASNLGSVELTMALHLAMDMPKDKIVFDVGHQAYTHKILTGRKEEMSTLRKQDGLSGFPKTEESPCDCFNTGHSSTSISAALGLATARDLLGTDEKICAVIGDGSLTGGMAYEALDQIAQLKTGIVIVLNDNEMSIGKNVGGMSTVLNKLRIGHVYNDLKSNVENTLLNIPDVGIKMAKTIKKSKDSIKSLFVPGMFFEELGITYVGPLDGSNVEVMAETFRLAFERKRPIIVHVKTVKGKGYRLAERYPEHFHGVGPFDTETGRNKFPKKYLSNTDVFVSELLKIGEENPKVTAITAAMLDGTGIRKFYKAFPERTFDVGIAEQHAVTFAAGLAVSGFIPVVAIYSSFLQRAYDQILHDVCLQNLHVIFAIDRSGLVGADGETHQGIYDTSYLREMPGLTILAPKNEVELRSMLRYAVALDGPVAIKYSKGDAYTGFKSVKNPIEFGKSETLSKGRDIAIISVGNMIEIANNVCNRLQDEKGLSTTLVNARFVKPIDVDMIEKLSERYEKVFVLEEAIRAGSFGEAVKSHVMDKNAALTKEGKDRLKASIYHFCIEEEIVKQGTVAEQRIRLGLDEDSVYSRILDVIGRER